jgi:Reverse transcriptase (RNA-dependent DNA polymerase)
MNVKTIFLNEILDENVYIVQLDGFVDPKMAWKIYKLKRSIYGLNQVF